MTVDDESYCEKCFFEGYHVLYGKYKRVSLSILGGENVLTGF